MSPIIPGRSLELAYPTRNRLYLPLEFVERTIEVTGIRDFSRRPLDARHYLRRPLVRRGRILVAGIEPDSGQVRKFWMEARHRGELPAYRLGLYDPAAPGELVDWIGRIFGPTERDRLAMKVVAQRWYQLIRERGEIGLRLAAYPVEG